MFNFAENVDSHQSINHRIDAPCTLRHSSMLRSNLNESIPSEAALVALTCGGIGHKILRKSVLELERKAASHDSDAVPRANSAIASLRSSWEIQSILQCVRNHSNSRRYCR
jgi:hypothetical protein